MSEFDVEKASKEELRALVVSAQQALFRRFGETPVFGRKAKSMELELRGWSKPVEHEEKETGRKFTRPGIEYVRQDPLSPSPQLERKLPDLGDPGRDDA